MINRLPFRHDQDSGRHSGIMKVPILLIFERGAMKGKGILHLHAPKTVSAAKADAVGLCSSPIEESGQLKDGDDRRPCPLRDGNDIGGMIPMPVGEKNEVYLHILVKMT